MADCLLCGASALNTRQDNSSRTIYNCGNCGIFVVSDLAVGDVKKHTAEVSAYLRHRQIANKEDTVLISFDKSKLDKGYLQITVDQILDALPKSFCDQIDLSLENLTLLSAYPGDEIRIESLDKSALFYLHTFNFDAMSFVIKAMMKSGFVDVNFYGGAFFPCGIVVSPAGWDRVGQLSRGGVLENPSCILYRAAGTGFSEQSQTAAKNVAKECGLSIAVSGALEHVAGNELAAELRHSDLVICDLSGAREESYYVVGFAQALGKTLALTCHEAEQDKIRLDRTNHSVIIWQDERELQLQLFHFIRARLL